MSDNLMTPRQAQWWERHRNDVRFSKLIERFGLEVVKQPEVLRGEAIQDRVKAILEQIALSPKEKMRVEVERQVVERTEPFTAPDLSYLKPGECPF